MQDIRKTAEQVRLALTKELRNIALVVPVAKAPAAICFGQMYVVKRAAQLQGLTAVVDSS